MSATIVLDQPGTVSYTNLDQISGKVVLRCGKSIDVESIVVKVEGESRTRLLSPPGPAGERPRPQLEYHKILYKVQTVFPRPDILEGSWTTTKNTFTLPPGNHEYQFSVKIPFNNSCASDRSQMGTMSISGSGIEVSRPPQTHVKKTLPPTLSGFPGEAEIRYFVKATVRRSSFWKENPRAYAPFNFFPIEPPRPTLSGNEVYARQKHAFTAFAEGEASTKTKMKSIFSKSKEQQPPAASNEAPNISVDARLPESSILTCNDDIPLCLIVKKLNDCDALIYLQSLEVSLIGNTKIKAQDVYRAESNSWVIMSRSNMGIPIGAGSDPAGTENTIADNLWRGQSLPNTVAPSFETCNISRKYQLDVRIGVSYAGTAQHSSSKPQTIILPLRLDVAVFSGIAPPSQLLEAMAQARTNPKRRPTVDTKTPLDEKLKAEQGKESAMAVPETPMEGPSHDMPARQGTAMPPQPYEDAPPSYEDAIATDLPPVDVPRPNYQPPPPTQDDVLRGDEKKGFGGRRDS